MLHAVLLSLVLSFSTHSKETEEPIYCLSHTLENSFPYYFLIESSIFFIFFFLIFHVFQHFTCLNTNEGDFIQDKKLIPRANKLKQK